MERKTVLITGAAKRIGESIALFFAKKGYDIALHYNTSEINAYRVKEQVIAFGQRAELFQADLSNLAESQKLIQAVCRKMPLLEVLVNSASTYIKTSISETSIDDLIKQYTINFFSPYILAREFSRNVTIGQIINIVDAKVDKAIPGMSSYLLSKTSLAYSTKLAALEFAPNIRVNGIAPGTILPPPGKKDTYLEQIITKIPLKRKGNFEELHQAIDYLHDNAYITGQILYIDGGQYL